MEPVSFRDLIAATGGRAAGLENPEARFSRVSIDTRTLQPGDLFWALAGQQFDGHNFLDEAQRKSAVAAVIQHASTRIPGLPVILVEDSLIALWDFARWYREQFDALVVAVTGSVGKTTTKEMIHATLSSRFDGMKSPLNFNNQFGVPLSLLQLDLNQEFAVLELAASKRRDIGDLAGIAQPEVGVITAIAPTHLDTFGEMENIARTKGELLESLPEGGFAVLNGDDALVRRLAGRAACRVIFVGEQSENDLVARWVRVENGWLRFHVDNAEFHVPVVGRHHLTAAMVCVAVGREVDMSDEEIASGLSRFEPAPGRCRLQGIGPWTVIDDTYNASPASMAAAARTLGDWETKHQKFLVLGDMLSLGERTEYFHEVLGSQVAGLGLSRLIAVGSQAATLARTAKSAGMDAGCLGACRDLETAQLLLDLWLEPGDVLLVKGSRGMHMEQLLDRLRSMAPGHRQHSEEPQRRVA